VAKLGYNAEHYFYMKDFLMFWQKDLETLSREDLAGLQLERLRQTVRRVNSQVPFYRDKFKELKIRPSDIRTLSDIRRLPMTTREDLRASYPYGLLAVPRDKTVRLHTSSGTTGKPKAIFFSKRDLNHSADLIARCLMMSGAGAEDVLQNMMTYGLFTGALVMHYGAEKIGMLVIPAGPGNSERQLLLMQDFGTTLFHTTPSFALYFADFLEKKGVDPRRDLRLRKGYVGAEPYSEETRGKIEAIYGIDVYNSYGLSEMNGPGVAFECVRKEGMHLWEDQFLMEIVDPQTGRPLPDGEEGELILTSLCREAMPILRYRTRDITSIIRRRCRCGRTHRRIARITGRADDMLIVRGVNIYPQQIERVLMSIEALGRNYQIYLEDLDEMTVRVELSAVSFDGKLEHLVNLRTEVLEKLRTEILIKPKVELVPPGTLPVSEGKAQRVIDKRVL
jgi:phenylacetate-CoA ligase